MENEKKSIICPNCGHDVTDHKEFDSTVTGTRVYGSYLIVDFSCIECCYALQLNIELKNVEVKIS